MTISESTALSIHCSSFRLVDGHLPTSNKQSRRSRQRAEELYQYEYRSRQSEQLVRPHPRREDLTSTSLFVSFTIPDNSTAVKSPYDAIQEVVKYYVSLGFVSVFVYWVAWACWIATAERQVRRMRYFRISRAERIFARLTVSSGIFSSEISSDKKSVGSMCTIPASSAIVSSMI